ncbi:hypothetical protein A1Q1_00542 [Trichosporon asahii var. asahii CBS 2479]|uniref:Uncharacterized protein n=1 Tax=Trichosporon asahii var. asahii (strain ATCC 90039 / CBS 2479 / JCM 2466 / KCTC 7840 / NBRC 103889/ NCYC 2677 / UAMH 7654) TaxID=1186058 RepID=J5TCB8_TRIAS|nr:hypothetical protein A1Q1_00542 [Trichosporon asahii var. asahii CBS 2479]EJT50241.1 hypothetical protein A1Q1_00542 [Trichosporon asahii var. asahii CBS 2479]
MARTIDRRMREAKESCRRRGGTQRMPKEGPKRAREKRMGGWACSTRSRARRLVGLGTLGIQPVGRAPFRSSRRSRICGDCCQESKFGGLLCLGDQLCAPGEPCAPCAVPDAQVLGRCFVAASVHIPTAAPSAAANVAKSAAAPGANRKTALALAALAVAALGAL